MREIAAGGAKPATPPPAPPSPPPQLARAMSYHPAY
jgi:hypothetical protein